MRRWTTASTRMHDGGREGSGVVRTGQTWMLVTRRTMLVAGSGRMVGVGSKQGMSGGMELIEAFVVWRVVVDVLLDLL